MVLVEVGEHHDHDSWRCSLAVEAVLKARKAFELAAAAVLEAKPPLGHHTSALQSMKESALKFLVEHVQVKPTDPLRPPQLPGSQSFKPEVVELRKNRKFLEQAVSNDGRALYFAARDLLLDQQLVLAAIGAGGAIELLAKWLSGPAFPAPLRTQELLEKLKEDWAFFEAALRVCPDGEKHSLVQLCAAGSYVLDVAGGLSARHRTLIVVAHGTTAEGVKQKFLQQAGQPHGDVAGLDIRHFQVVFKTQAIEDNMPVETWPGIKAGKHFDSDVYIITRPPKEWPEHVAEELEEAHPVLAPDDGTVVEGPPALEARGELEAPPAHDEAGAQ